eukprot:TRINITY_DN458_c0_g1_i3.p1 TRINITY_DN458_c0_g1~~TRINITY_DN458_c0_g1_i3.p1  ORF type:complete len:324 (+),score=71.29 TRINITY_DN458_c0_g1_i3:47-973(+)
MNTAMQAAPLPSLPANLLLQSPTQLSQSNVSISTPERDLSSSTNNLANSSNSLSLSLSLSPVSPSSELKRKEIENLHLLEDYEWQSSGGSQFSKKAQCMRSRFHCAEKEKSGCTASYIKDTAPNTSLVSLQFRGEHNHPKPMKKRHKSSSSLKPEEKLLSIQLQENKAQTTSTFQSSTPLGMSSSSIGPQSFTEVLNRLESLENKLIELTQSPLPLSLQQSIVLSASQGTRDPKSSASVYLNGTVVNRFLSGTLLHEIRVLYPNVCLQERVEYGITHVNPNFAVFGGSEYDLLFPQGVQPKGLEGTEI